MASNYKRNGQAPKSIPPFVAFPTWVLGENLNPFAIALLLQIIKHCDFPKRGDTKLTGCYLNQRQLADLVGIPQSTVSAQLQQLESIGAIRRTKKRRRSGGKRRHQFAVYLQAPIPVDITRDPIFIDRPHDQSAQNGHISTFIDRPHDQSLIAPTINPICTDSQGTDTAKEEVTKSDKSNFVIPLLGANAEKTAAGSLGRSAVSNGSVALGSAAAGAAGTLKEPQGGAMSNGHVEPPKPHPAVTAILRGMPKAKVAETYDLSIKQVDQIFIEHQASKRRWQ